MPASSSIWRNPSWNAPCSPMRPRPWITTPPSKALLPSARPCAGRNPSASISTRLSNNHSSPSATGKTARSSWTSANPPRPLLMKVALSYTGIEGARANLAAELPHWDFDRVHKESLDDWNTGSAASRSRAAATPAKPSSTPTSGTPCSDAASSATPTAATPTTRATSPPSARANSPTTTSTPSGARSGRSTCSGRSPGRKSWTAFARPWSTCTRTAA